jgi:hypothetical protein
VSSEQWIKSDAPIDSAVCRARIIITDSSLVSAYR